MDGLATARGAAQCLAHSFPAALSVLHYTSLGLCFNLRALGHNSQPTNLSNSHTRLTPLSGRINNQP